MPPVFMGPPAPVDPAPQNMAPKPKTQPKQKKPAGGMNFGGNVPPPAPNLVGPSPSMATKLGPMPGPVAMSAPPAGPISIPHPSFLGGHGGIVGPGGLGGNRFFAPGMMPGIQGGMGGGRPGGMAPQMGMQGGLWNNYARMFGNPRY